MSFAITAAVVTVVGTAGNLYAQNKASKAQQKAANVQNARERKEQLKAIRMAQRNIEFQGQASGTGGGSAQAQASGSVASNGATKIGAQSAALSAANEVSHWNRVGSGFGALAQVGATLSGPDMYLGKQKGKG